MNSPYQIIDRSGNASDINQTAPPRPGAIGPESDGTAPNGDEGVTE